jgi:hypothetical protein
MLPAPPAIPIAMLFTVFIFFSSFLLEQWDSNHIRLVPLRQFCLSAAFTVAVTLYSNLVERDGVEPPESL